MYYEVYIPSPEENGFDVTITVDAENWMSALKSGLERTGEGADAVRNVMCDIKDDNSIHVTDATTQRVFVLEELGEEPPDEVDVGEPEKGVEHPDTLDEESGEPPSESAVEEPATEEPSQPAEPSEPSQPTEPSEPATGAPSQPVEPSEPAGETDLDTEDVQVLEHEKEPAGEATTPETPQVRGEGDDSDARGEDLSEDSFTRAEDDIEVGSQTREALQDEQQKSEPRVVDEHRERSDIHRAAQVGRQDEKVSESLIEDVFLEIQPIHEGDQGMEEVVNFVMDLAMEKIAAESGSILFADTTGSELYFAAARGPKANEIMDFRVPMGEGIVGFCSKEGVSLAVSDAQNDPRFYEEISESIGYETDSLLCSPIQYEGRVYGAIELINRADSSTFTSDEMNALSYIGGQLAEYVNRVVMQRESLEEE